MQGLLDDAGRWRNSGVGIYQDQRLVHMAPPDNDSSAPSRYQVGTKLNLSTDQLQVFEQIEGEMSLVELMVLLNRKDRTKFWQQVLTPLIDLGLVEATIPDKPTSSRQKYRLKREDD